MGDGGRPGASPMLTDGCALAELLEDSMRLQSPRRIEELVKIFIHATKASHPFSFAAGPVLTPQI